MDKSLTFLFLIFNAIIFGQERTPARKILFVATNVDVLGKNENGTYKIEIAYPFRFFTEQGFEIDIVTPKGGKTALYPGDASGPGLDKILKSELFQSKTKNSLPATVLNSSDYSAVYIPGGYGQFFDVANDHSLLSKVAEIYEAGGVLGTAGHGAASLVNIKVRSGDYFVNKKMLTCFPTWFEQQKMWQSDYGKLVPFDMEKILSDRGAILKVCEDASKITKECVLVVDETNRLVTGAFADNALEVAEEMVRLIRAKDPRGR